LGLPYDEVHIELDAINNHSPILWALSKIYTYSLQEEPFLHIDGDVYIWKPFEEKTLKSKVIAQNLEIGNTYYYELLDNAKQAFKDLPDFILNYCDTKDIVACNAGVLGANDLDFIRSYCQEVFRFVDSNEAAILSSKFGGGYNVFFEQFFFAQLAIQRYRNLDEMGLLLEQHECGFFDLTRFGLVPRFCQYIHMLGMSKSKMDLVLHVEHRLAYEFPEIARHINMIFDDRSIFPFGKRVERKPTIDPEVKGWGSYRLCRESLGELLECRKDWTEDEIISQLQENFENPAYYRLWDLFQMESSGLCVDNCDKLASAKHWDLLYHMERDEFLKLSFVLNPDVCAIVHLYYQWELAYRPSKDDVDAILNKEESGNTGGRNFSRKLMSLTNDGFRFDDIQGWFSIFECFDDQVISGNEIIDWMMANPRFKVDEKELATNVYLFLSTQYFVYHRILPCIHSDSFKSQTPPHNYNEKQIA
jgi:hypothetical protein